MMVVDLLCWIIVLCFWVGVILMLIFVVIFIVIGIWGGLFVGVDWKGVDLGSFWVVM